VLKPRKLLDTDMYMSYSWGSIW